MNKINKGGNENIERFLEDLFLGNGAVGARLAAGGALGYGVEAEDKPARGPNHLPPRQKSMDRGQTQAGVRFRASLAKGLRGKNIPWSDLVEAAMRLGGQS